MMVNIKKSQVVHHRNPQRPRCASPLYLCGSEMEFVSNYKYLGCYVNEFSNDKKTVDALVAAAEWSFSRIVDILLEILDRDHTTHYMNHMSCQWPTTWQWSWGSGITQHLGCYRTSNTDSVLESTDLPLYQLPV